MIAPVQAVQRKLVNRRSETDVHRVRTPGGRDGGSGGSGERKRERERKPRGEQKQNKC